MAKRYDIRAEFPGALIPAMHQGTTVVASGLPLAVKRGLTEIMRRDGIKRKQHKIVKLTVVISDVNEGGDDGQGNEA